VSQIPSHPIADDSQPTESSTAAQPVSRPKKRVPPTTVDVGISNICYYKYICVISNDEVIYVAYFNEKE
jgi:hypothetical protein